jgi:hypothetical protein
MWQDHGRQNHRWTVAAAVVALVGCGDGGTAPPSDNDGRRLAAQFEQLADSVDSAGWSPTADALRHAAEIVRLTGHATPVTLTIDGAGRSFLAVAEQLDFPNLVCSWPSDSGIAPPPDTIVVQPGDSGTVQPGDSSAAPLSSNPLAGMDSVAPPPGGTPGQCTQVGVFSMRTLIAWEPERMAEVVRIVADVGSNGVAPGVPDVMTGLPTNAGNAQPNGPTSPPAPGDTTGGGGSGGGGTGGSPGFPGFMGEYLVRDVGSWFAVDGRETNAMDAVAGACTSSHAAFDWAEFTCDPARFQFEFAMRVEPIGVLDPPGRPEPLQGSAQPEGEHAIAMASTAVDGVRLSVVAWTPPPLPPPGPLPPDSTVTGASPETR